MNPNPRPLICSEPAMSLLVRTSTDADLSAIAAIYAHAVEHGTASFELAPPSTAEMERRRAALRGGYPVCRRARRTLLGYAYAGPYRPRAAYRSTVEDLVYVAPGARGRASEGRSWRASSTNARRWISG